MIHTQSSSDFVFEHFYFYLLYLFVLVLCIEILVCTDQAVCVQCVHQKAKIHKNLQNTSNHAQLSPSGFWKANGVPG